MTNPEECAFDRVEHDHTPDADTWPTLKRIARSCRRYHRYDSPERREMLGVSDVQLPDEATDQLTPADRELLRVFYAPRSHSE